MPAAANYSSGTYVEIPGSDHLVFSGDALHVTAAHIDDWIAANHVFRRGAAIYHPRMNRAVMVLWMASTVALSGVAAAGAAHAGPPPPPGTPCSFTLSPPQVVQLSGANMVTATVTPAGCGGPFRPYLSVVCVQDGGSPAQCTQARDADTAQVYAPYHPGGTYTSTGRGLGTVFNDAPEPNWQLLGPFTAAL